MDALELIERFDEAQTALDRWDVARVAFAELGSEWITYGSAARSDPYQPTIVTSAPDAMIDDYLGAGLQDADYWLDHCRRERHIDNCPVVGRNGMRRHPLDMRIQSLFEAYGAHLASLVPAYSGSTVGGIVAFATDAEAAAHMLRPEVQRQLKLVSRLLAVMDRPETYLKGDPARVHAEPRLTPREIEALSWLAAGHRTEGIAERMGIRPVTVDKHVSGAKQKFNVPTREAAVAVAVLRGFVSP